MAVCYANRGGLRSGDVSERSEEQGVHRPSPFVMLKVQHRKYIQAAAQWSVKYKRFLREPWVMRCSPDNARPPPALCKMGKLLRGERARRGSRHRQLPPASPRGGMSPRCPHPWCPWGPLAAGPVNSRLRIQPFEEMCPPGAYGDRAGPGTPSPRVGLGTPVNLLIQGLYSSTDNRLSRQLPLLMLIRASRQERCKISPQRGFCVLGEGSRAGGAPSIHLPTFPSIFCVLVELKASAVGGL